MSIAKYFSLYFRIISFKLKSAMEYRFNFLIQTFYGPAYIGILFLLLNVVYSHSPELAGWTKAESFMLFSTFHILYAIIIITFLGSIRHLMWSGVRLGELDVMLTKPVHVQFLASFFYPEIQQLLLFSGMAIFFLYNLISLTNAITPINFILFLVSMVLGYLIAYFSITTYATLSFRFVRAQQILETFDKVTDYAHYPITIFPKSIGLLMFTFIPVGFYSFFPTSLLLGKGSAWYLALSVVVLAIIFVINQLAWKYGLRKYSSASS